MNITNFSKYLRFLPFVNLSPLLPDNLLKEKSGDRWARGTKSGRSRRSRHHFPRPVQSIETRKFGRVY